MTEDEAVGLWHDDAPVRFRVAVNIFRSLWDDVPETVMVWEGSRVEVEALAAGYAKATVKALPWLHMEVDTVEVIDG